METATSGAEATKPYSEARALLEAALAGERGDNLNAFVDALHVIGKDLAARYPDHRDYHIWHLITGSSGDDGTRFDDFPGADAVLPFLKSYP